MTVGSLLPFLSVSSPGILRAAHRGEYNPLNGGGVLVGLLEVRSDEAAIAQRRIQTRMPKEPSYLVEAHTVPQAGRGREVAECVRVQSSAGRQGQPWC